MLLVINTHFGLVQGGDFLPCYARCGVWGACSGEAGTAAEVGGNSIRCTCVYTHGSTTSTFVSGKRKTSLLTYMHTTTSMPFLARTLSYPASMHEVRIRDLLRLTCRVLMTSLCLVLSFGARLALVGLDKLACLARDGGHTCSLEVRGACIL